MLLIDVITFSLHELHTRAVGEGKREPQGLGPTKNKGNSSQRYLQDGSTPLIRACLEGRLEAVSLLLEVNTRHATKMSLHLY